MSDDISTWKRDSVVCPWCGYEHTDSWEMKEGKHECGQCEKPFEITEIERVSLYSTKRI